MAHMQRSGRIGGDEFNQHALAGAGVAAAVGRALLMDTRKLARAGSGPEIEIDETGAGDFGARHQLVGRQRGDDGLRQLARIAARRLGQPHGDVAGEVAVLRIAGALHRDLGGFGGGR